MSTKEIIQALFEKLGNLLDTHKFLPRNIYNCDETSLVNKRGKVRVIARAGKKNVYQSESEQRLSASLLATISATGEMLPPLFVFQGVYHVEGLLDGAPEGSLCANGKVEREDGKYGGIRRFPRNLEWNFASGSCRRGILHAS